jgi:hypothetical protein
MVNLAAPSLVGLSFAHRHSAARPARRLPTMDAAAATTNPVDDGIGGVGAVNGRREVIDLQTHTVRDAPANALFRLSVACRSLDVNAFDVYGDFDADADSSYLRRFEAEVSRHFGKEDGVFCPSGGMAQSIVLAINAGKFPAPAAAANRDDCGIVEGGRRRSGRGMKGGRRSRRRRGAFACHPTCHLLLHENDAYAELLDMDAVVIEPDAGEDASSSSSSLSRDASRRARAACDPETLRAIGCYGMEPMRLSHVRGVFDDDDDAASASSDATTPDEDDEIARRRRRRPARPARPGDVSTLILELPHREVGGKLTPWDEVEGMSRLCEKRGMRFHCDGARIFEASAGYG